jgi:hypothetical protein
LLDVASGANLQANAIPQPSGAINRRFARQG